jgi:probable F420-dependent oxidoreductase
VRARITRLTIVGVAFLLVAPFASEAQPAPKAPRVGWLSDGVRAGSQPSLHEAFLQGLRDLGYVEGQTVVVERRDAAEKMERLDRLATELVSHEVNVIVATSGAAALAAKRATSSIPIVMAELGVTLPVADIGTGPTVVRDYAQAGEALGYSHLLVGITCSVPMAADRGVFVSSAAEMALRNVNFRRVGSTMYAFHDPFVLFGFLTGYTQKIGFAVGVFIVAQRQAALVAKQAASLDILCGGRFRLGIGVGWNEIEFIGLNENFHNRGRRSEEQVRVMQALWAEPHVTFTGEFHRLEDVGINPRPASGRVPIWFGGDAEASFRRAAKNGDGFMPLNYPPGDGALTAFEKLRKLICCRTLARHQSP